MGASAKLKLVGEWEAFHKAMDRGAFEHRLAVNLLRAGERVGRYFQRASRAAIRAGNYAPNSPVTIILKGSSKPLVNRGDLFQSLTFHVATPYELRLGIMRSTAGDEVVNVGVVLHEGATINVKQHPKVRAKVWAMIRDRLTTDALAALNGRQRKSVASAAATLGMSAKGTRWTAKQRKWWFASMHGPAPASTAKDVWIIPARPFITSVVDATAFRDQVLEHYGEAVAATFRAA